MSRILTVLMFASALFAAGQSSNELPSAPSAVLKERNQPAQSNTAPSTSAQQSNTAGTQSSATSSGANQDASANSPAQSSPAQQPNNSSSSPANPSAKEKPQAAGTDDEAATTIRTVVNEVNLIFTVTDKHGRFIKDLKAADITLLDDNKPPAKVEDFRSETDLPLRVGLLVDASNSIRDRFTFEQQAAIEFLSQIIRPRKDFGFVLGFDTTPEITQDFTSDADKLAKGVRALRPGGGTALFDALYGACRDKLLKYQEKAPVTTRRAIILLSDGEDNQSRVTREESIEMAQRADTIVYTISTNVSGTKTRGDKVLERIAEATGGRAFFPFKIEDVANAFSEVQEELRSQYAISYKPADFAADGRFRSIQISAANKKFKVRARKGYFAPRGEVAKAGGD
jgi:Ca-activated chloride channel family protein